jgi:serine/threonine-protein kinase
VDDRERLERAVAGRYHILQLIGRGAMSTVYLGWEPALARRVAIKVLAPSLEEQLEDRERFRREARIAAQLEHHNIVPVYAFERVGGVTYAVMRYVAGESLAHRLEREGPLAPEETRRILADLADALDCVHRHGVIHRDLKPANVLLDDATGRAMLTDFGVATLVTSDHSRSEMTRRFGTPHYMSPEQALGEPDCDGRSDLYALGVLGFQLLTGRLPFDGASPRDVAAQHVAREAPPVTRYAPEVPEALARAIARCLAKDPRDRWPDGRSLREALGARVAIAVRRRGLRVWLARLRRRLRPPASLWAQTTETPTWA